MPTAERRLRIDREGAQARIRDLAFASRRDEIEIGRIGLEIELFPIRVDREGRPNGRVRMSGPGGTLEILDRIAATSDWVGPRSAGQAYPLAAGGRLTLEPGGQAEHSTAVHGTAAAAIDEIDGVVARLRKIYAGEGAVLAAAGVDLWHDLSQVPQQLDHPRYRAMHAYFERRGPSGGVMMRHTTSIQINLDLGRGRAPAERWLLANLVSPIATATFASSPSKDAVSARALAWQGLDPTRTGFPRAIASSSGFDPATAYAEAVLAADVLLFWKTPEDAEPGDPGWSFDRWIREGHPRYGWPTAADLDYHLSTLFFEVRPRGFLELRAVDGLPEPWRTAPAVLLSGLLYDPETRAKGLALLEPLRPRLHDVWRTAALAGVRDREIGPLAAQIWELAVEGARRLPHGFLRTRDLEFTSEFLQRYTLAGRMPADDLREAMEVSPAAGLRWAAGG
jgi:glutamate--cysteine ligase